MPRITGKETFERLRKIKHNIPIIISSGFGIEAEHAEMLKQGAFDIIQKPFDLTLLLKTIKNTLSNVQQ